MRSVSTLVLSLVLVLAVELAPMLLRVVPPPSISFSNRSWMSERAIGPRPRDTVCK